MFERQGYLDTRVADIVAEANVAQGVIDTMLTVLQVGSFTPEMRDMRLALRAAFVDRSARGIRRLDPGPECPVTSAGRRDDHCEVVTASADGVATITLSNPARKNAMSIAGWAALRDAARGRRGPGPGAGADRRRR